MTIYLNDALIFSQLNIRADALEAIIDDLLSGYYIRQTEVAISIHSVTITIRNCSISTEVEALLAKKYTTVGWRYFSVYRYTTPYYVEIILGYNG